MSEYPIYKLTCEDHNNQQTYIYYSPHESKFWDSNREVKPIVGFDSLPQSRMYTDVLGTGHSAEMCPENPSKKIQTPFVIKIQMGLKCNYSCAYCCQAIHSQNNEAVVTSIDDANEFLLKLDTWLKAPPKRVELWGGEPFVYWEALQVLVDGIHIKYPDTEFSIVTNGSLLDDEKYDFICKYDIGIALSHDGPGQHLRGPDPLDREDTLAVLKKFVDTRQNRFSFNSVITAKNCDVLIIRQWFVERFGEHVINNYEGIATIHSDDARNYGDVFFTQDDYYKMQASMYKSIIEGYGFLNPTIYAKIVDTIRSFKNERSSKKLGQKCGMDREGAIAVDLKGNVLTCTNTGANSKHNIGSVYDFENISLNTSWHWSQRESCNHCLVLQVCQGSCMYLDGDNFVDTCNNEYAYNLPILLGSIELVFGLRVSKIEGDIRRPQKSKEK